jgi:hypothetical protein
VDELFITLAPKLAGGPGPTIVEGPPLSPEVPLSLLTLHAEAGELFLRYGVAAAPNG